MLSLDTLLALAHHDPLSRAHGLRSLVTVAGELISEKVDVIVTSLGDLNAALGTMEELMDEFLDAFVCCKVILAVQQLSLDEHNDKQCRLMGIRVLTAMASRHADLRLPSHNNKRLHDILFVNFSDLAICSFDADLRVASFTLLTNLHHIDVLLAKQAFTKTRLVELSEHVADSACGVFVHGMEDEMEAVRLWCVRAIFAHTLVVSGTQILSDDQFVSVIVDTIVDAFLDDASLVRLMAVKTLTSICIIHRVRLSLDRADLTLQLLVDGDPETRRAVRSLLQVCLLEDQECCRSALKSVSRAHLRHPLEFGELMVTIGKIGHNHANLIVALVPTLLRIDNKYFGLQEPRVEDPNYMLVLSLILNSVAVAPDTLLPTLPAFLFKQYHYVRAKHRHAIPRLLHIALFNES